VEELEQFESIVMVVETALKLLMTSKTEQKLSNCIRSFLNSSIVFLKLHKFNSTATEAFNTLQSSPTNFDILLNFFSSISLLSVFKLPSTSQIPHQFLASKSFSVPSATNRHLINRFPS
jgi:hypothetical protein